jgi:hypothetical protein
LNAHALNERAKQRSANVNLNFIFKSPQLVLGIPAECVKLSLAVFAAALMQGKCSSARRCLEQDATLGCRFIVLLKQCETGFPEEKAKEASGD